MFKPDAVLLPARGRQQAVTVDAVDTRGWPGLKAELPPPAQAWAEAHGFAAEAGRHLVLPSADGKPAAVVFGLGSAAKPEPFAPGRLARALPPGTYALGRGFADRRLAALAWCLESYHFGAYGKPAPEPARLLCPADVDRSHVLSAAEAAFLAADLINTPAADLGPDELESACRDLAQRFKARLKVVKGTALQRGFPMIHAVGQASDRPPRLIDFTWGAARAPKVTLVGKGVCFDTGGLDIKPAAGMQLMKKDMGGAATVLGLARMIMTAKLPVRLRVLIPAVENAISGNAFRPGDVLQSRKGITVEIGNTDAEGRLILGDALALADEERPDLLVDLATLTGAARVALGPDLPPFYTDDEALAAALSSAAAREHDPVWRLPFWEPYSRLFESTIAGMNNSSDSGFAGSITAALFLKRFVDRSASYVHFDIFGWTPQARPGWPKGGAAQAMRTLFAVIRERYAK